VRLRISARKTIVSFSIAFPGVRQTVETGPVYLSVIWCWEGAARASKAC
jgi:hypothetical protein